MSWWIRERKSSGLLSLICWFIIPLLERTVSSRSDLPRQLLLWHRPINTTCHFLEQWYLMYQDKPILQRQMSHQSSPSNHGLCLIRFTRSCQAPPAYSTAVVCGTQALMIVYNKAVIKWALHVNKCHADLNLCDWEACWYCLILSRQGILWEQREGNLKFHIQRWQ